MYCHLKMYLIFQIFYNEGILVLQSFFQSLKKIFFLCKEEKEEREKWG